MARFLASYAGIGAKAGPVLLQVPPRFRADPAALDETLSHFPPTVRVAVEPRDVTWWTADVRDVLLGAAQPSASPTGWAVPSRRCGGRRAGATCASTKAARTTVRRTGGGHC